ncbi:MAG TPA: ABC-F family ATP-binding cassette domain-containing protein [Aestuariivirgaceae bacterium]|jgi:ATP-binding cassette subfamily F protein 3|nr:ABC-F family ATP-binding cassette domain-containing protein [Aestuariivirgaceae bacterium]
MLHINELTYRIDGRLILDAASAVIPTRHKVGLVGRNGVGKSTLLRLILGDAVPEAGSVSVPRHARIGTVAQEAPSGEESLIDTVLAADLERTALLEEADNASDPGRIADIQMRLVDIAAHSAPARAAQILAGLGFRIDEIEGPCSALSGGWRMRVALAAALFAAPDVLLLDEPSNYLDLEGVIWLKSYIRAYPATVVIVSHDRDLLNDVAGSILLLERGKLTLYQGNYDSFERQRREQQALTSKLRKKQEETRRHMEAFVERFRYKASKARQAQSRLKALARLEPIAAVVEDRVHPFRFPDPAKPLNPPLMRFESAAAAYDDNPPVLTRLNLRIDDDDRIALLGANGNGKSTFAKLITGKLAPAAGRIHRHSRLGVGYFAQHQLDELEPNATPYDSMRRLMPDATEAQRRARLGFYGFGADLADTPAQNLSGGEKARLLFALAAFHGPHLLVLDEPTNHLDVDAREALVHALNEFAGAVVLISHDRHLIETCADRLWIAGERTIKPYDGDLDSYAELVLQRARIERQTRGAAVRTVARERPDRANPGQIRRRIADVETAMGGLRDKIAVLDRALEDGSIYREEPRKAADFAELRRRLAADLERQEEVWLELQSTIDALESARDG